MKNNFYNKNTYINLYEKPSYKSKISSQIIYGEKFKILYKKKGWLKIKTNIFSFPKNSNKYKQRKKLPFASRVEILKKYKNFIMFEKNKWIYLKDIKKNNFKEKNFIKILNLFINCKYKWGGKTFDGIDCSALVQMYYLYNNKYFPRDTKDQIKIRKGQKNLNNLKKGNIIYWKGHVAVCINSKKLIHAYGPRKKVLTMNIKNTIEIIEKTANLKVRKITKI